MSDSKLPPPCKCDLRSSAILCSVDCLLLTDVSGHPDSPMFKGHEYGTDVVSKRRQITN